MADLIAEWAGKERLFRLTFGGVLDLQEALGGDAIGAVFLRVSTGQFKGQDIWHTIRLALIGGGETVVQAKQLLDTHFDQKPYMEHAALAGDILIALMAGVEDPGGAEAEVKAADLDPIKFSEAAQICRTFHMSPQDLRDMPYADFINMVKGFNASGPQKIAPPTEEEFKEILAKYEPEALTPDG